IEANTIAQMSAGRGGSGGGGGGGGGGLPGDGEDDFNFSWTRALMGRKHSHGRPPGWLGYLLGPVIGGGAAVGSVASLAGFGTEHILSTLGGVAGSGLAA